MEIVVPESLTLIDFLLVLLVFTAIGALVWLVAVVSLSGRSKKSEEKTEDKTPPRLEIPGVPEAVAKEIARKFHNALKRGDIRVRLFREDCRGEVVYELASGSFKCLEDGHLRVPDEQPAGEIIIDKEELRA